jgi:hypothetical protein
MSLRSRETWLQQLNSTYPASLPVLTSHLRNSQWRTSSIRSLLPFWYQRLSQSKAAISSAVKPHWASPSLSGAPVSPSGAMVSCSEGRICVFIIVSFHTKHAISRPSANSQLIRSLKLLHAGPEHHEAATQVSNQVPKPRC